MIAVDAEAVFVAGKALALGLFLTANGVMVLVSQLGRTPAPTPVRALPSVELPRAPFSDGSCPCGGELVVDEGPGRLVAECTSCGVVVGAWQPGAA